MNSDLEIMKRFAENTNDLWSDNVGLLKDYISNNFNKQQKEVK